MDFCFLRLFPPMAANNADARVSVTPATNKDGDAGSRRMQAAT